MRPKFIWLLCIVLCGCLIPGCNRQKPTIPTIRIGYAPHDHHAPLFIAAANPNYFRKNGGLYLKTIEHKKEYILIDDKKELARIFVDSSTGGKEIIRRLSEDHFDFAFGGVPAIINYIDQDKCIRMVAPIMTEGAGLVVKNDISANTWDEFITSVRTSGRQLRIGYKIAVSSQNLIFEHALSVSAISFSHDLNDTSAQIVLVNLYGAKNLIPALEKNFINGFVANQPYPALAEFKKAGKTISSLSDMPPKGKWQDNPCCALAACSKFTTKQPLVSEKLVTLMLRANRYISQDPQAAAQIAAWLDIPVEVEEKSLPTIHYIQDFNSDWNKGVDFWIESMIKAGKLTNLVKKDSENGHPRQHLYNMDLYRKARGNL